MADKSKQSSRGHYSPNFNNDGDVVFAPSIKTPSRTYLYSLCKLIIESNIPINGEYSLKQNSAWQAKLDYNGISDEYKRILTGEEYAYDIVNGIMVEFANSEVLVLKVHHIYLEKSREQKDSNANPDNILINIFEELRQLIANDENSSHDKAVMDEDRDRSIWLIMFYVFTKCKLLEPVR